MVFVGLIIAAAMPAGISIVFLSDLIGGEPTKALVITTLSHVLSPIITPIIIWFFAHKVVNIDFIAMLILIGELVLVPLISAQIIKRYKNFEKLEKNSSNLNLVLLFLLIWSTLAIARNSILYNIDQFIISSIVILFLLFLTIIFSIWFGRNRKEDITWAVAGTYKNFTLASVIALTMFGPVAMVGAAVYNVLDNILLVPIKWLAAKYNRPEKK
jgi:BASS family bile acid:Na+ symporter